MNGGLRSEAAMREIHMRGASLLRDGAPGGIAARPPGGKISQ
jgi:hypothetical protein